ncbi:hypothetical protein [Mesorhizobium sp. B2-4-6]|uniref:hypothetical protein n=1 Tax=Mesorhizobium sp. B2-4-6 TaxID=2589943 RepID=UPI0015E371EB|nr:hypothetical protein [Mesorhizobium sp. B2-4-6]
MRVLEGKPQVRPHATAMAATAISRRDLIISLRARMAGPGGYYNFGNALGLTTGITVQFAALAQAGGSHGQNTITAAVADYFAGSPGAIALTLATLVFFCSGEIYHRAWAERRTPDQALNRLGDLLSGLGAIGLGVALYLLGDPLLAATSGLLHALGKFGSAYHQPGTPAFIGWPGTWPDPFRSAVLASRLPAIAAAAAQSWLALPATEAGGPLSAIAGSTTLLVCYLLWAKADLMLFRSSACNAVEKKTDDTASLPFI